VTVDVYYLQVASNSVQPQMNVSFGIEFDDDMICAVDKLVRDYVLHEVNSGTSVTEATNQDVRRHRKEKVSTGKVATANPPGSGCRETHTSDGVIECLQSKSVEDAMSMTVIKGHGSEKAVSSAHNEANEQDVVCTWNSPLLVSTPIVIGPKRRVARESFPKTNTTNDARREMITPNQHSSVRKPKTKKEKTKLFEALVNNSLSPTSHAESPCLQSIHQSPERSSKRNSCDEREKSAEYIISVPNSKLWIVPL